LQSNTTLMSLNLAFTGLGPESTGEIAKGIANHPSLTLLNLAYNSMGNAGASPLGTHRSRADIFSFPDTLFLSQQPML